jgi:hypothetical protein
VSRLLYWLNYFDAPVVKEQTEEVLILESIRNKVWNPVFTIGAITFFLSMTLRGFFDQSYAVFPLAVSTLVLFAGIWILSAYAIVVFDKKQSQVHFIYKHLGYLQKTYTYPLTSVEEVRLSGRNPFLLELLNDDRRRVAVAKRKEKELMKNTARSIAGFLAVPLQEV